MLTGKIKPKEQARLAKMTSDEFRDHLGRAKSRKEKGGRKLTLLELQTKFLERKAQKNITEKTISDYKVAFRILSELIQVEFVDEIDFECAEDIVAAIRYYPKNKIKDPAFNGVYGYDAIYLARDLGKSAISASRALGIVQRLSTFMNYCVRMEHAGTNVFRGQMSKHDVIHHSRKPFTKEHLASIFSMEDYRVHSYRHPYYYWMPLLLRYTGARLNELCSLYTSNIIFIGGVACLVIDEQNEGQRVKNNNSIRVIPIHSELVRLGFLSFVNSVESDRLFPELKLINGYFSHNASKWFSNRRANLGLGRGLDCYSFRHKFITELRERDTSFPLIMSLVGHMTDSEQEELEEWCNSPTNRVYSHSLDPTVTAAAIESIDSSHTKHLRPYFDI